MSRPRTFDCDPQSLTYVERLLQQPGDAPSNASHAWHRMRNSLLAAPGNGAVQLGPTFSPRTVFDPVHRADARPDGFLRRVDSLVEAYRNHGHRAAAVDPLRLSAADDRALRLECCGLNQADLDRRVGDDRTLAELVDELRTTYCGSIAYQFSHLHEPQLRRWLLRRIEQLPVAEDRSPQRRVRLLRRLTEAERFDAYLRKKHPGAKTFSLEGAESLIVLLDAVIDQSAAAGINEIVIGMAHRGRLNVLANVIGKPASMIFREFNDVHPDEYVGGGDVKYHLGASCDRQTAHGELHLSLCFNPSHLEIVAPIALGRVRARQRRTGDAGHKHGLALLIHGDAAFAGEGVVQETLNLSQLPDYEIGGALHVILNNQLGFTTTPDHGRSMTYASDVACMLQSPILRVNGDDVDAVLRAVTLALDFRREFRRDVVIDFVCYRRWGHNEIDEPGFTQPLMYRAIEQCEPVRQRFAEQLVNENVIPPDQAQAFVDAADEELRAQFKLAQADGDDLGQPPASTGIWHDYLGGPEPEVDHPDTAVEPARLCRLLQQTTSLPNNFHLHPKLSRAFEQRQRMARGEQPLDWAAAEAVAFASIAAEGHSVRLSGQDSQRGTFSQRHAVLHDSVDGHTHSIFGANVHVINSPLSEAAAMAFEYGYSLDDPASLVLWEAQFGDFANAAQVVIDQFLSSAEDKWERLGGLVLLLPHGFEGQGPEHSSARLERWLTLAAEDNLQILQPSTPAQYFHALRRQALRRWRKPLIVLTPKSLLRHRAARSPLEQLSGGSFQRVLSEPMTAPRRLLICSGKLYYELADARRQRGCDDVALLRVEQFYPLSDSELAAACAACDDATQVCWVQEEPQNMGAWPYWKRRYGDRLLDRWAWQVISRPDSASTATGSHASHKLEQQRLIARAFGDENSDATAQPT